MNTGLDDDFQELLYAMGVDAAADASVIGVAILDAATTVTYVNDALCRQIGVERSDLLGMDLGRITGHGSRSHLRIRIEPVRNGADDVGSVLTSVDMSRAPQAASGFRAVDDLMEALIGAAGDAVIVIDAEGDIQSASKSCRSVFGWTREDLVGAHLSLLMRPEDAATHQRHVDRYLQSGVPVALGRRRRLEGVHRDGSSVWMEIRVVESPSDGGSRFIGFITDLSEMEELRSQVSHVQEADGLTGLLTRESFVAAAGRSIAESDVPLSLVKVDIARFHYVNTAHGYETGDDLLRAIAREISSVVPQEPVGRVGGDRFGFVVPTGRLDHVIRAVRSRSEGRGRSRGISHPVKLHVGVCHHTGAESLETLMRSADAAVRAAKQSPGHLYLTFDTDLSAAVEGEARLVGEMHRALSHGELVTYFQPEIDLANGSTIGHEALVRWQHPERGILAPDVFLALATGEGLMPALGVQVFAASLDFIRKAERRGHAGRVWVNLTAGQLFDDSVVQYAKSAIEFGTSPDCLGFELTEQDALAVASAASENLDQLLDLGVALAIDDFGTGYSTLSQLRTIPAGVVKLDRSFLVDIHTDHRQRNFVGACINLAHTLDKLVVVEGVETAADARLMAELGCESAQGYWFGRPVPADQALDAL